MVAYSLPDTSAVRRATLMSMRTTISMQGLYPRSLLLPDGNTGKSITNA